MSAEQLLTFFNQMGEVKYIRMAGDETQPTRFAFVEFTDQSSVANALQYNGVIFGGRPLKWEYLTSDIIQTSTIFNWFQNKPFEQFYSEASSEELWSRPERDRRGNEESPRGSVFDICGHRTRISNEIR